MSRRQVQGSAEEVDADEERGDRMRWNKANQARFEAAVEAAGGVLHAMPRAILDALDIPGVSYAQVKSHLQRHRTAYVADCLARGEVVDVSEAQLRASQALLEKRAAAGGGSRAPATSSRRRPASSMQRSDGSSPPQSLRQRLRSESVTPMPMVTDGEQLAQGCGAPAAAQGGAGPAGRSPVVRGTGSGTGCDTDVSGSEQASEPQAASSLVVPDGRSGQPGSSAGAAAAVAAAAAAAGAPGPASAAPASQQQQQQAGAAAKLEDLLARVQQLHAASDLLVAQMQEQQRQHQRAWQAMQQALEGLQRECTVAIQQARQEPAAAVHPAAQPAVQQPPQLGGPTAGSPAGPGNAAQDAQLLQTLLALSSQQLPVVPQQVQQAQQVQQQVQQAPSPVQLGSSQGGLWEQRLRAQLAGGLGGSGAGMGSGSGPNSAFNSIPPLPLNSLSQQPPAAQPLQLRPGPFQQAGAAQQQGQQGPQQAQQGQQQGQQAQQQAALPVDDAVSMLLNCFPTAAGGGDIGSDLQALLKSSGSDSGDSLLDSLLRAAGGQPGVDDLAAMLASM